MGRATPGEARGRVRARRHRPPDLTSLFDVLFIVVFAALIRAAAIQNSAAQSAQPPLAKPQPPPPPAPIAALQKRALADLDKQLASRTPLVIRVSEKGVVDALEAEGKRIALDVPLLEHSPDPDIALAYLGDRSAELRLCKVAALRLKTEKLSRYLVIVAPARALADLPHALVEGLRRDVERCLAEQQGLATVVDPSALASP
jgi:hypothetical protein